MATDESGIERTPTGEIVDQALGTKTEPEKTEPEKTEPEKKADPEKKGETLLDNGKKDDKKEEPKGAPEKYEDFKVPEGITLDPEMVKGASELFKTSGLTQEQAQQFVDFHVKQVQAASEAGTKAYTEMRDGWRKEAAEHPELKGKLEGEKAEVKVAFGKLLNSLGDASLAQSFKEAMNLTGAGDNPAFIRVMYKLAGMLTEGGHVSGGKPSEFGQKAPGQEQRSAAKALYPNLP